MPGIEITTTYDKLLISSQTKSQGSMTYTIKNTSSQSITISQSTIITRLRDSSALEFPLGTGPSNLTLRAGGSMECTSEYVHSAYSLVKAYMQSYGLRSAPVYLVIDDVEYVAITNVYVIYKFYNPVISKFELFRHTNGELTDDGINLLTTIKLDYDFPDYPHTIPSTRLYYAENGMAGIDSDYIDLPYNSRNVIKDASLISKEFSSVSNWDFLLVFGDEYESAKKRFSMSKPFANVHFSGASTGGVCLGGYSSSLENNPKFESYFPGYFYNGIEGVTNYSSGEVMTGGRWIDGRPIYRNVILISNVDKDIALGTGAISSVISIRGIGYTASGIARPLPYAHPTTTANATLAIRDYATTPTLRIVVGSTGAITSAIAIVEYTKAADAEGHVAMVDSAGNSFIDASGNTFMVEV